MRRKKGFDYGEGKFYMIIKNFPNNITLHRSNKDAAQRTFERYQNIGKDIEWLGMWDGKNFI